MTETDQTTVAEPRLRVPAAHWRKPRSFATSRRSGRLAWRDVALSDIFLGFVVAVLSWPISFATLKPVDEIDYAYRALFQWALVTRHPYGTHFSFTYGPLGFLTLPVDFYRGPAFASLLFELLVDVATAAVILRALRRSCSLPTALLLAYLVTVPVLYASDVENIVVLGLGLALYLMKANARPRAYGYVFAGFMTAVGGLIKVSLGPALFVIFLCAVLFGARSKRVDLARLIGSTVAFTLILWVSLGNRIQDLPEWIHISLSYTTGYSAMALEAPGRRDEYTLACLAALIVVGLAAWGPEPGSGWQIRILVSVMALIPLYLLFKEGFIRHDAHDLAYFSAIPLLIAVVGGDHNVALFRAQSGLSLLTASFILFAVGGLPPVLLRPGTPVAGIVRETVTLLDPGKSYTLQDKARSSLRALYDLPSSWVHLLAGQPVVVEPFGQSVQFAYPEFRWAPLPTLQEYAAYTVTLDKLNANFYGSQNAPKWVLDAPGSIDNRNPLWDPPLTQFTLRCNYTYIGTGGGFYLLEHTVDRCGRPILEKSERVSLGSKVVVPKAPRGYATLATFNVSSSLVGDVASLILKGTSYEMRINDGSASYRFIPGTGPSFHLLADPTVPETDPLAVMPVTSFVLDAHHPALSKRSFTVKFYRVSVRAPAVLTLPGM